MDKEMWDKLMNTNWWEMFVKFVFEGLRMVLGWISNLIVKVREYVYSGEYQKKHISFLKDGNKYRLVLKSHNVYVDEVQKMMNGYKKKGAEEKYINFALKEAMGGCTFIIFSKGKKFVQFWTSRGRLEFDFPILKGNGNKKYYYSVLGLLADMDFVRDTFVPVPFPGLFKVLRNHTYKIEDYSNGEVVKGYFNKMTDHATKFTRKMFEEIYKTKGELEVEAG